MCCATACPGGGSAQPESRAMIKAAAATSSARVSSKRVTEPPCPPEPVIDVRDEALAVVAPCRVEFLRHLRVEHLGDAAALAHQILDALAHDGEHLKLLL